jgi:opacity protein-like surface antigen
MKKITLTSASIMSALSLTSSPTTATEVNWQGFYGGLSVGYQDAILKDDNHYMINYYALSRTPHPEDVIGSGFAGYNYQIPRCNAVVGLEASYDFGGKNDLTNPVFATLQGNGQASQVKAVNARIGYPIGKFLPYIQGGLASARTQFDIVFNGANIGADKGAQTSHGWTEGFGVDYLVTDHLFLRANYSYTHFAGENYVINQPDQRFNLSDVKMGIGYKF